MSSPFSKPPNFLRSTQASRARSSEKQPTSVNTSLTRTRTAPPSQFYTDSLETSPVASNTSSQEVETPAGRREASNSPDSETTDLPPQITTTVTSKPTNPTTATESKPNTPSNPLTTTPVTVIKMGQTKIRAFKGLRNGREDPNEYLEDIEWAYEQDFKGKEPATAVDGSDELATTFSNKTRRILFHQHLQEKAEAWNSDLDSDIKVDWPKLRSLFLTAFPITLKDAQTKKFELRVKLHNLEQGENESIADYLEKANELAMKLPNDDIDVGMATLKGMRDLSKRERVTFECTKDADYTFTTV